MFEVLLSLLGASAFLVGAFIYGALSWGYVLLKFWSWFVLPVFPNMPHISFAQAVGLVFVFALITHKDADYIKYEFKESITTQVVDSMAAPWLMLICAWFLTLFL